MVSDFKLTFIVVLIGILAYNKLITSSSDEDIDILSNHVCNISKQRATKNMYKSVGSCNRYIFTLLLALSHDTELNPGPRTPKWPCGTCHKAVTWKHKALCCDTCDTWYHIDCQGMSPHLYPAMDSSNVSWHCILCGLPNFSTTLFDSYIETSNQFTTLDSLVDSELNLSQLGEPTATSSPAKPAQSKTSRQHHKINSLRVINVNFQSIKNKKPELDQIISSVKPDIILGTETWLSPDISSYEYVPESDYTVYRRDRPANSKHQSHGGVLIAISKSILSEEVVELQSNCENVWAEVNLANARKLIIGCYYRPPSDTGESLDQLRASLSRINMCAKSSVLLGGDFNLGHIDWSVPYVLPGKPDSAQHHQLINIINDLSLEQIVDKPTRGERTLDLILTNTPSLFNGIKTLPPVGNADHDIVFTECETSLKRIKKQSRTIFKYTKANWENIKSDIKSMTNTMTDNYTSSTIDDLWDIFKQGLLTSINKNIPQKNHHK